MKCVLTCSVMLAFSIAFPADAAPTVQDFDFVLTQYGTAPPPAVMFEAPADKFLRITEAVPGQINQIAFDRTDIGPFQTIDADFDFRVTPSGLSEGPADGFSIVFVTTALFGPSGAVPSFQPEDPSVSSSLGIGFDYRDDVTGAVSQHIDVYFGEDHPCSAEFPFDVVDGAFHHAHVTVKDEGSELVLSLTVTASSGGSVPVLEGCILEGVAPYETRVVFAGRTGGAFAAQDLDNVNVRYRKGCRGRR